MTFSVAKLGEVCSFVRGLTYSKSDEVEFSSNVVVRATNIDLSTHKLDFSELRYISDSIQVKDDKRLKKNDILICTASGSKNHLGKVALVESDLGMSFGGFMGALRVNPQRITSQYLFTFLVSSEFKRHIESLSDGANINNLKFSQIEHLELPLPTLATQQKIVAKLDAIFTEIDKATAAAEANARQSYAVYSSAVDSVFGKLDDKPVKLSSCSDIGYGYTSKSSSEYSGLQYLRITDIQDDSVDWLLVPKIEAMLSDVDKYLLKDGDIVFARTGATTGKSFLIKEPPPSVFASYLIRVDVNRDYIEPEYLRHFFKSEDYWLTINAGISGAAQGGFNASKLGNLTFPLPNLATQQKMVKRLDAIEAYSIDASGSQKSKVKELNFLRNSILRQAFAGELVKD